METGAGTEIVEARTRPREPESPEFFAPTRPSRHLPLQLRLAAARRVYRDRPLQKISTAFRAAVAEEVLYQRPLLMVPVLLAAGSILWFERAFDVSIVAIGMLVCVFAVLLVLTRYAAPALRYGLAIPALLLGGMTLAYVETWRAGTIVLDTPVTTTITGHVERREGYGQGRWRYVIAIDDTAQPRLKRPPLRASMIARSGHIVFDFGERISGRGRLTPPAGPALPLLHDFAFDAYFDGIGANGYFYGAPQRVDETSPIAQAPGWWGEINLELYGLRSRIGDRIRSIIPGDTGAFAAALVTDERRAISKETTEALRTSGLAHIIAISGLNMALSAGIFFVGMRSLLSLSPVLAQSYPIKKWAAFAALLTVTAYFMISGYGVSAERAFIMMAIMLIAVFFNRPSISMRNIALSAILIVVMSPSEVLGPSFQMSFAATLALVAGYANLQQRPASENAVLQSPVLRPFVTIARFFAGITLTSMIGGISTALFSVEHFHRFASYGLPANLAAMPIISFVVMPAGLLAMLLMPFGLDVFLWKVVGLGLDVVIGVAKYVAAWGGNIGVGRLPGWFFPVSVAGFLLFTLLRTRLRYCGAAVLAGALILVNLLPDIPKPDMLISEDGRLVALVGKEIRSNRTTPPDFIFSQWQRALAIEQHKPPDIIDPESKSTPAKIDGRRVLSDEEKRAAKNDMAKLSHRESGGFSCRKNAWCLAKLPNADILVTLDDLAYLGVACDTADIIVTSARLKLDQCRSGAYIISASSLRRTGALEIRFEGDAPMLATAFSSLSAPWDRHRAYDWRSDTFKETESMSPLSDSAE